MAFTAHRTLRFGDCDPSGIAYFPAYLDMLVGVVEEFFEAQGVPWPRLIGEWRMGTPTVTLETQFTSPGRHGDALDFHVRVAHVGRSSLDLEHDVHCGGALLWRAKQRLVATSLETHTSCPWPDPVRRALESQLETDRA